MIYDLIIVGGGPTGISCGIEAELRGLNYIILEKGFLVNSIYHFPTNMTFFSTAQKIEIGNMPFIAHNEKPTRSEALEYYRRLAFHYNLSIRLNEKVNKVKKIDEVFSVDSGKLSYQAKNVIIATGFYDKSTKINVPGEEMAKVKHYYDDAHPYIMKDIVVIGGANSACDVALETWSKGARVTMVVRESDFYQGVKYWILPNIKNRVAEGSIMAYFNANVRLIEEDRVIIDTPSGEVVLANDYVLAMTGYEIDYDFIISCGIGINDDAEQTPCIDLNTFETNVKGLYLAGVLHAGRATSKLFIENTKHHGKVIVDQIANQINGIP